MTNRVRQEGPQTFFTTHDNQIPSLSEVYGFKDFLYSAHLLGSFVGQIYSYGSVLKSIFVHQGIQEDGHYRENHESLRVRRVDCRVL